MCMTPSATFLVGSVLLSCVVGEIGGQVPSRMLAREVGQGALCDREQLSFGSNAPAQVTYYADFGDAATESRAAWIFIDSTGVVQRALVMWGDLTSRPRTTAYSALASRQPSGTLFGTVRSMPMLLSGTSVTPDSANRPSTVGLGPAQVDSVLAFSAWLANRLCTGTAPTPAPHRE